ncbi:MAG: hypothetical protein ACI87E_004585 [Mariniblastus sp.]|jgi:uncharacterized protein YbbC (DUF1343 family)/CubicO group peptidase (beta-lactamase class C family)
MWMQIRKSVRRSLLCKHKKLLTITWWGTVVTRFITTLLLAASFQFAGSQELIAQIDLLPLKLVGTQKSEIDRVVEQNIQRGNMAGCVVAIGDRQGVVFLRSYGQRQIEPTPQDMTIDTVFDLASLTKPIATATSIMKLVEQGRINLDEPAFTYWPEFGANGKDKITIWQLLTHQGGLIPDNHLREYEDGTAKALENICNLKLNSEPGSKFVYTDVGFIVLAEIVRQVSGKDIDVFSREQIYQPLRMVETMYRPDSGMRNRAATTEKIDGEWARGKVHDPRAARMNGIAGHAGLFSTAGDLSRFARMLLGSGSLDGAQVLKPETFRLMTHRQKVSSGFRTLGWDSLSGYSSNRGDLFSQSAFGHGGFTGTSFWVDPELDLFVILLSNRLHPDGQGSVNSVAGRIGTIAAASRLNARGKVDSAPQPVLTGIDILERDAFRLLKNKRVGLITNQTGINRVGKRTAKLFHESTDVNLVALFSPEHGIDGTLDVREILNTEDEKTGVQVLSLYGENRSPSPESLKTIDVLVFDIQDIGTRFYTYISTMGLAMEACENQEVEFIVLDRPNPINGVDVQGPGIEITEAGSFTSFHNLPVRHGMTVGELAKMFQVERGWDKLKLKIVEMEGWDRARFFDQSGLRWVNPSPNMRNLTQALLYPGIGLLETTNLSVGRGTGTPFEVIGAPWINEIRLARGLNELNLPGVRFIPIQFTPVTSKYKNEACRGVNIVVTDRQQFHPLRTGFHIANYLANNYHAHWKKQAYNGLLKNSPVADQITSPDASLSGIAELASPQLFENRRSKFLIYD